MARFNGTPGNASDIMKQFQGMRKQMEGQAKAFENKESEATTGGDVVRVTVIGGQEASKTTPDEDAVDPDDAEMLENLTKTAVNEAFHMAEAENQQMMDKLTGGLSFQIRERIFIDYYGKQITRLIEELSVLPGIGRKSTQCLAFHIISMSMERVASLTDATHSARQNVRYCKECFTLADEKLCSICKSTKHNRRQIMVVESTRDLTAYEKTGKYEGVYRVLRGTIPSMLGTGPSDTKSKELVRRLENDMEKAIIATNPSLEGETTVIYIARLMKPTGIKTPRIASGVPVGGDLGYTDEVTLLRVLKGGTKL